MRSDKTKGTYREVYVDYSPYRVNCPVCGLLKEIKNGADFKYEFWFKTTFKDNSIWAYNIEHIDSLIEWLKKGKRVSGDYYEALPKWMMTNRKQVIKKLEKLKEKG